MNAFCLLGKRAKDFQKANNLMESIFFSTYTQAQRKIYKEKFLTPQVKCQEDPLASICSWWMAYAYIEISYRYGTCERCLEFATWTLFHYCSTLISAALFSNMGLGSQRLKHGKLALALAVVMPGGMATVSNPGQHLTWTRIYISCNFKLWSCVFFWLPRLQCPSK